MYLYLLLSGISCVYSELYDKENATKLFEFYTIKYHKLYDNATAEENGLQNFVNNLNKVSALNEKSGDNSTFYILNKYADMDTEDIQEKYAISLKPYVNTRDPAEGNLLRYDKGQSIEDTSLYDLTKADKLYKDFMKKYDKKTPKKERDRTAQYYRFIKTLVEINRNNFEGNDEKALDANADVIKNPLDYFY